MINPPVSIPLWNVGKAKLVDDVVVVVCEARSEQPLDVFKYEPVRAYVPDCPNRLRKHIALIRVSQMLASNGEGLARWATGHELDSAPDIA